MGRGRLKLQCRIDEVPANTEGRFEVAYQGSPLLGRNGHFLEFITWVLPGKNMALTQNLKKILIKRFFT